MSTMEFLAVGWRAARQAARTRPKSRTRSAFAGAVLEHGLSVVGFGCLVAAAAVVAVPLGLAAAGLACFLLEMRLSE